MPGGHKAGLLEGNYQPVLYFEHAATAIRPHGRVKRAATAILLGSIIHETQHLFGVGDSVNFRILSHQFSFSPYPYIIRVSPA